jgi:dTMP kinase
MEPLTELILTNAARAELAYEVIRPALQAGAVVIAERFSDTSVAYQGMAGSLGAAKAYEANTAATGGIGPARTFVLTISPEEALARRGGNPEPRDRGGDFMAHVAHAYEMIAISARSYVKLDATESIEEIAREVRDRIRLYELELKKAQEAAANDPFGAIAGMGGITPGSDMPPMPPGMLE